MASTSTPSSDIKRYKVTEPWLSLDTKLGEAPYWHRPTNTLRFVDIVRKLLYQVDLSVGPSSLRTMQLPISVSTTAEIAGGNGKDFVFGGKGGIGVMDRESGQWRYLAKYWGDNAELEKRFRGNDGAVDARGRYFVGTMNDPEVEEPKMEGTLFRLDPDLSLHKVKYPVQIPNGMSWTLDNKFIYVTESSENKITKYPYDIETGAIDWANGKPWFSSPYDGTVPDGHAQDAEGCFWISLYGSGKVVRVSPEGVIIAEIELPTRCCTCPGIAGEDLYITSAEEEDPKKHPESAKFQGGVFKVHIGVKGAPLNEFKMQKSG